MSRALICAGDYSADIHGESLVTALRSIEPGLHISSLGGLRLKKVSHLFIEDLVGMDISGFTQPFLKLPRLANILLNKIHPILTQKKVDRVILIDYYDFNIRVAEKARECGIPVFYFVSPQVWASRKNRIHRLKKAVTHMLVIFPFEEDLYRSFGVPATFVGHPFLDKIGDVQKKDFTGILAEGRVRIGLMPGSRQKEIYRHLPIMLDCFEAVKKKFPGAEASLFAVDFIPDSFYSKFLKSHGVELVRETDYSRRKELCLCLTASGTATLENALCGVPMVVIYRMSWFSYTVARTIIQVSYISMPNILAQKAVVPELIQGQASTDRVIAESIAMLSDAERLAKMHDELLKLKESLGQPGAYRRAAEIILKP